MRALIVAEGKHELSGALRTLVSRLRETDFETIVYKQVRDPIIHIFHGIGKGYLKRAVGWLKEAKKQKFDVLVLVIDEDGDQTRIAQFNEAQVNEQVALPRAFGVAVRMFDAWMLADETAVSSATGRTVPCQPNPEGVRVPKTVCREFLEAGTESRTQSEMYVVIAESARLDVLERRCPIGFAPFADRIRALPTDS